MKYSIQETTRTVTVEATETDGKSLERAESVIRQLVKPASYESSTNLLLAAPVGSPEPVTEIDGAYDPFESLTAH